MYSVIYLWFTAERWRSCVFHGLLAIVMIAPFKLISLFVLPWITWVGVGFVIGWFHSREKTQYEYLIKGNKKTSTVWDRGWIPRRGNWGMDSIREFVVPVIVSISISIF